MHEREAPAGPVSTQHVYCHASWGTTLPTGPYSTGHLYSFATNATTIVKYGPVSFLALAITVDNGFGQPYDLSASRGNTRQG